MVVSVLPVHLTQTFIALDEAFLSFVKQPLNRIPEVIDHVNALAALDVGTLFQGLSQLLAHARELVVAIATEEVDIKDVVTCHTMCDHFYVDVVVVTLWIFNRRNFEV